MSQTLRDKLEAMEQRVVELERLMADPKIASNGPAFAPLMREHGALLKVVEKYRALKEIERELAEATSIQNDRDADPELRQLAREEAAQLQKKEETLREEIKRAFFAGETDSSRNAIMEIRAGTGGEEAALFVADLFRMYAKFAESQGWNISVLDSHPTDLGGFKEIIFMVEGPDVFRKLRHESGGHRVQRVPLTEANGRIHTSLVTVAVLPEAEEVEVEINPADLHIETCRASGPGGQKVNKTSSAVRITHLPTGIVVKCQECPSQLKNRAQAMRVLRSRLFELYSQQQQSQRAMERRSQIGSGDRNERIRTYNFPDNRVTDHRIGLTIYALDRVMEGEIGDLINALIEHEIAQREKTLTLD